MFHRFDAGSSCEIEELHARASGPWRTCFSRQLAHCRFYSKQHIVNIHYSNFHEGVHGGVVGKEKFTCTEAFLGHQTPHKISVSSSFCAAPLSSSLLPWCLIYNCIRLKILGNVPTLFCNATPVPWRTGRTKVALVELPTVNMFGFFFCTPFPLGILAWSFVVPRSNFHPPKAFNLIDLKAGDNWPSHTCHTKWTWKCDPRLTEMDALSSFQEA